MDDARQLERQPAIAKQLSMGARWVLSILERLMTGPASKQLGYAFPLQQSLVKEIGCSRWSVARWVDELRAAGRLRTERSKEPGGQLHYFLLPQPDVATVTQPDVATVTQPDVATVTQPDVATVSQPDVATVSQHIDERSSGNVKQDEQQQPAAAAGVESLAQRAQNELLAFGVDAAQAAVLALGDPALALVVLAHCQAKADDAKRRKQTPIGPGYLVKLFRNPVGFRKRESAEIDFAERGIDPFAVWELPPGSPAIGERGRRAALEQLAGGSGRRWRAPARPG
jgi:hypothetical protein